MPDFKTERFDFDQKTEERKNEKGEIIRTTETKIGIDTEDIFVIGGIILAMIFALGMVFGMIPVNKLTVGVLGLSAIAAGAAKIVKARKPKEETR